MSRADALHARKLIDGGAMVPDANLAATRSAGGEIDGNLFPRDA